MVGKGVPPLLWWVKGCPPKRLSGIRRTGIFLALFGHGKGCKGSQRVGKRSHGPFVLFWAVWLLALAIVQAQSSLSQSHIHLSGAGLFLSPRLFAALRSIAARPGVGQRSKQVDPPRVKPEAIAKHVDPIFELKEKKANER